MIKIDSITINEFRGIRDLTLPFNGGNYAICGPNGTGKSGVVDALEFVLTGNISRLSGEGRGDISLKLHAPHVDKRDDPENAWVSITFTIPSLKKTVTLKRNVKHPAAIEVTPNNPDILEVIRQVHAHPEIVLSRREIIRYVLATPGKRAEEVQSLLHLDQIESVRVGLQKIANGAERLIPALEATTATANENLFRALAIATISKSAILKAANTQRTILGLADLVDFTATTSLKDGMAIPQPAKPQLIPKAQALVDIAAARESLDAISNDAKKGQIVGIGLELQILAADPTIATNVVQEGFYTTGLSLLVDALCPFCEIEWELDVLKAHVQSKMAHLKEVSRKRKAAEKTLVPLITPLRNIQTTIETAIRYASLAKPPIAMPKCEQFIESCQSSIKSLAAFLPLSDTIETLEHITVVPVTVRSEITALENAINALPEPNKQDAARDFLTIAQERLDVWRDCQRKQKTAKARAEQARVISDTYSTTSDKVLAGLYDDVQSDFATLYRTINHSDEKGFAAKLVPSMGKLGFDVNFYDRGFFPPGAYHSEGHQDGMGLCLYLALMRHLQGSEFGFAVLDDVLMSVDTGHRREVCALLKREFPNTQFIVTTHDPIWLRLMKTEGMLGSKSAVQFKAWDVDRGPTQWDDRDVWTEIDDYLASNDARSAAALLRHYLEYTSAELCHRLRAPVEFRADAQYQLGELLPAAVGRLKKLYGKAKESANSWGQRDILAAIETRETTFQKAINDSMVEQWQINIAVHFNSWENLTKADFKPVADAYRHLLESFGCPDCNDSLRVSPERDSADAIRCECGKATFNLLKKPR